MPETVDGVVRVGVLVEQRDHARATARQREARDLHLEIGDDALVGGLVVAGLVGIAHLRHLEARRVELR